MWNADQYLKFSDHRQRLILNDMDDEELDIFLPAYKQRLQKAYPIRLDGNTLYPFRRLFIVASL